LVTFLVVIATLAMSSQLVLADRTINSVTLNGASSVTVATGASITAVVNVTTTGTGTATNWRCTRWRIGTGSFTNVNHANHDAAGTFSETFTITAPNTLGTFDAQFIAFQDDGCTTGASSTFTLSNAVTVVASFTLTVSGTGSGSGTIREPAAGTNINCSWNGLTTSGTCSHAYTTGTVVTLTVAAGSGSSFIGWSGNTDCSDGSVTLDANKSCTATFSLRTGVPELSPPWIVLLMALFLLLIFREFRRRARSMNT